MRRPFRRTAVRAGLPGSLHSGRSEKRREPGNAVGEIPSAAGGDSDCCGAGRVGAITPHWRRSKLFGASSIGLSQTPEQSKSKSVRPEASRKSHVCLYLLGFGLPTTSALAQNLPGQHGLKISVQNIDRVVRAVQFKGLSTP